LSFLPKAWIGRKPSVKSLLAEFRETHDGMGAIRQSVGRIFGEFDQFVICVPTCRPDVTQNTPVAKFRILKTASEHSGIFGVWRFDRIGEARTSVGSHVVDRPVLNVRSQRSLRLLIPLCGEFAQFVDSLTRSDTVGGRIQRGFGLIDFHRSTPA
jgi:hypothetical protein